MANLEVWNPEAMDPKVQTPTNFYGGPIHGATKILNTDDLSYTIAQQTFGKSQTVAFHTQKWVQEECSHSIAELHCSDNEDTMDNWQENCTTLIDHFLHSPELHCIITENVAGNEPTTTKVAHCVQSMDVVPNPHLCQIDWCLWILYMLPMANDNNLYTWAEKESRICSFICFHSKISHSWMFVYIHAIKCMICKSDSHGTHSCPYTEMDTWSSPRLQVWDVVTGTAESSLSQAEWIRRDYYCLKYLYYMVKSYEATI